MIVEQTEEIRILQDSIREFGENEIAPHVMEWDEAQQFPLEIVPKLADLGILGAMVPAEYGGAGLSYPEYIAAMEEISRIDGSIGLFLAAHNSLCCGHILLAGTEDQKRRYLPDLARGVKIGAWALTEPGSGSDASAARTTAVRIGDEYVVNGTKHFITNATNADIFVLMASTDRDAGRNGLSAFILDRATPGLTIGRKENKLGLRASDTAGLVLEDCRIPAENLLGEEGGGFADCLRVLDGGRISIAAMAVGMAQGAFEHALKYATERQQFGKPIAEFQVIQFKLADMATEIEAARLLTYRAAELKQSGAKTTKESSMAKLFSGEVAVRVAGEAVQIHGGYGFIKDFPVEKYYRDVKLCTIGEGTSEIQRTVIARQLLRK
jgi:alkylation response protein AidB-like acyl-CoA dehydrogenase